MQYSRYLFCCERNSGHRKEVASWALFLSCLRKFCFGHHYRLAIQLVYIGHNFGALNCHQNEAWSDLTELGCEKQLRLN